MKVSYTQEQKKTAVQTYKRLKSYTKTVRALGYPSTHVLHDWVKAKNHRRPVNENRYKFKRYPWDLKLKAVQAVASGQKIQDVADCFGVVNYHCIYDWIRIWRTKGHVGLMSKKEQIEAGVYKTKAQLKKALPDDIGELKEIASRLLAEKAVLEQQLELSKKLPGGIPEKLPPMMKSEIAASLRGKLPLELLFDVLRLKRSSYYHYLSSSKKPDKYAHIRAEIERISSESGRTYGSPRIWLSLRRSGIRVSEKVVRRLMKEERILVRYAQRKRRYSSYIGEITPAVEDKVQRNFHADRPDKLWLTDISEFAAADAKVYLSPMVDCFDGKIVSWSTSKHPDSALVESMLDKALEQIDKTNSSALTIHTDRGGHYRGAAWIERLEGCNITRSMSRKGNSGDNAACEGFFGRMKNEMYYGIRWESSAELEKAIDGYIEFYNNRRIKASLGGLSIKEYREGTLENV